MADTSDDEVRELLTTNVGQRVAGGLMLVNAILVFAEKLFVPTMPPGLSGGLPDEMLGGTIAGGIFDIVIGGALLGGNSRVVGLAIVRVILGLVVFGGVRVAQGDLFLAAIQVAVSAAFLLVLVGRAGKLRIALAGLLFGLYVLMEAIGLYVIRTGHNPIGGLVATLRDDVEGPAGEVVGLTSAYRLRAPSDKWLLRKAEAAKKDNPLAERWLTRPDLDVHALVIAENVPGSAVPVDALAQVVINNAQSSAGGRFDVLANEPSARYPQDGRQIRAKAVVKGMELDFVYGVFATYGHGYQVITFAPSRSFAEVEPELRAIVDSFTLPEGPPELLEVPARAPAGRVVGVAAPYAFTAPNDRWFLRSAEAAHKDSPLTDQQIVRPDRDASVFVIVEQLPGPTDVDTFAAAVEAMIAGRPGVDVSPRQRWSAGATEGRLIHARALMQGMAIDYDYAVFVVGDRGFQVVGFSRAEFYPHVKAELLAALASFEPPH